MGIFDRTRTALGAASDAQAAADLLPVWRTGAHVVWPSDIPGLISGAFGLDTANMVPAFRRGMSLITGVAAGLPVVAIDPPTGGQIPHMGLLRRTAWEPGTPNTTLLRRTVADMVAHGRAYWQIIDRDGNRWPTAVRYVDAMRVTGPAESRTHPGRYAWMLDGDETADLIDFVTGESGALDVGWLTLRTAIALESAATNYADSPMPSFALQSTGIDLDDADAMALIQKWNAARRAGSTAYLNSQIEPHQFGWNASELQLVEARSYAAIEIARLLNLDPVWVGASPSGSSLTYQNRQDMNQSLLDGTVMPLLRVMEQRLTMPDVTGEERAIRFDTSAFLRANLPERVAALTAYTTAGILTKDEARAMEPLITDFGRVPE